MRRASASTVKFSLVQGGYWMGYCIAISYAAVYLRTLGCSNARIGVVLAVGNTLSFLLGSGLAAHVDRRPRRSLLRVLCALLALQLVCLGVLILTPDRGAAATVAFAGYIAFSISVNAMELKLCVDLNHAGVPTDFGTSRGIGALAYVLLATFLGTFVGMFSAAILPWIGAAIALLQLALSISLWRELPRADADGRPRAAQTEGALPMGRFLRSNGRFVLFLFGTGLVFMGHNSINSYLINIVDAFGGDTRQLGYLQGFSAAVEVPVMILFGRFAARRRNADWVRLSLVFFVLKSAAIAAARSMVAVYLAFLLQPMSYALFAVAVVPYVDESVAYRDSAKGQSLTSGMYIVGLVLSGLVTGRLLDAHSVPVTFWICAAVTAVGAAVAAASMAGRVRTRGEGGACA